MKPQKANGCIRRTINHPNEVVREPEGEEDAQPVCNAKVVLRAAVSHSDTPLS